IGNADIVSDWQANASSCWASYSHIQTYDPDPDRLMGIRCPARVVSKFGIEFDTRSAEEAKRSGECNAAGLNIPFQMPAPKSGRRFGSDQLYAVWHRQANDAGSRTLTIQLCCQILIRCEDGW